jgi:hypothetical protein
MVLDLSIFSGAQRYEIQGERRRRSTVTQLWIQEKILDLGKQNTRTQEVRDQY